MSEFEVQCDSEKTLRFTDPPSSWRRIAPPKGIEDVLQAFTESLKSPAEGPPLLDCLVPGDQIAIAVDHCIPQLPVLLKALVELITEGGIPLENITLVTTSPQLQQQVGESVAGEVKWFVNQLDAEDDSVRYLASTTDGHRIYLAAPLVDADLVIPMTLARYEEMLGISGGTSQLYPQSAGYRAAERLYQEWHPELSPTDPHSVRQTSDEVGWLAGLTFAIYVLPGRDQSIAEFVTGLYETGYRAANQQLEDRYSWSSEGRIENVICRVQWQQTEDPWWKVMTTLMSAQRLVAKDGRIILLTELEGELPEPLRRLQLLQLPKLGKEDLAGMKAEEAFLLSRLIHILKWAQVSLYSKLDAELVEELFLSPLTTTEEVRKLMETLDEVICVTDADMLHLTCE